MAWQGIAGHDAVAAHFAAAAARGRIGGAHLFVGPPGVGKGLFARRLVQALACHQVGPDLTPCGRCESCVQAAAESHPDIELVRKPDDRATIPLDAFIGSGDQRMREGLCWRLLLKPLVAVRRAAVILDADHLSLESANALLKTLEEPPAGAVIILVGTSLQRQLPTIRSRCQVTRFGPLDATTIHRVLSDEIRAAGEPVDEHAVRAAAVAAAGSLDRARLLLDPELAGFRRRLTELLLALPGPRGEPAGRGRAPAGAPPGVELSRETVALVEAAGAEASRRRERLRMVLESAIEVYRSALRHAATGTPGGVDTCVVEAVAAKPLDVDEALAGLRHTLDVLAAVDRNANLNVLIDAWSVLLEPDRRRAGRAASP